MLPLQLQGESHVPLYVQIRDQLRAMVHSGELRPGDRIPASRELARHLGVHRTTVANAYAELESEGLIQGHVGRGTFIRENGSTGAPIGKGHAFGIGSASPVLAPAPGATSNGHLRWDTLFADERGEEALSRLMPAVPAGAISFIVARPAAEYFPIDKLTACAQAALKHDGHRVLQLGSSDGFAPLKRALCDLLKREGIKAKEDQILVSAGCQQALDLLSKAFLRPGDAVILENPTYPGALAVFSAARVRCLGVNVRTVSSDSAGAGIDLEALETTLVQNRVKLIVVTPDFQSPTGTTMPVGARRRLLDLATRHQVPIVEDHIYARLHFRSEPLPSLKSLDRNGIVIHVDSFSKIAFPGLRVGWIVAPETVIDRLRLVKQYTDLHTDQLAQATMAEFVQQGFLEKHVKAMRRVYASRLSVLLDSMERHMPEGVEWTRPEGGMCIWVTLPPGFDASELSVHARERGVLFSPGRYFYVQVPRPNAFRLGFAGVDERKIARGVEILGEELRMEMRSRQRGNGRRSETRMALV
ncbi:MAG TPA: PLP-dependent aminotransferase family protein [Candidatus Acidoferrum sp.]|nr:PLP-dependent aminotransferase family protein [Candidatus Acidoferrum sp.]